MSIFTENRLHPGIAQPTLRAKEETACRLCRAESRKTKLNYLALPSAFIIFVLR